MNFKLREYQSEGVEKLRMSFRSGKRAPLYVLPTGGGKTAVFSFIAEAVRARGKRVSILVHRQELLFQASRSLSKLGVSHGLISPRFAELPREPVQVASVQTLVRRLDRTPAPDLVIVDEAHHSTACGYRKILDAFPRAQILGVTATPIRTDGAGLCEIFDDLILGPSVSELISQGHLVQPTVYAPPVGIDLSGVHRRMGDYDKTETLERVDRPKITGDVIAHYRRLCDRQPAIAFCVSVRHAEHVAAEFRSCGYRALRVDGGMEDQARKAAIEGLGNGSVDVLTSADLIGEGVDIPRVAAAILLRPTYSTALFLQQVGRALRPYEGKSRALILDHVGNTMRHGLPDDDRTWSLDGADRKGKRDEGPIVRVEQCEKCYAVYETGPDVCPQCGHNQPSKIRKIEIAEGELAEITRAQLEAKKQARIAQVKAKTLEELIEFGRSKGYHPGWAKRVHAGRQRGKS